MMYLAWFYVRLVQALNCLALRRQHPAGAKRGAMSVEYIIILVVIAIAGIAAFILLRDQIANVIKWIIAAFGGESGGAGDIPTLEDGGQNPGTGES